MSFKNIFCAILSLTLVGGVLTGCGEKAEKSESTESEKTLPELDEKKIAADEARGIRFSKDKRTLIKYNKELPDKEYTIPNGVTSIGKEAFILCKNLTTITIPNSVTSIGAGAFKGDKIKVVVAQDNPNFSTDAAGALIDKKNKTLLYLPSDFSGEYIIPDDITSIGEDAFYLCYNLTTITIPNSETSIGEAAFACCKNLTTITIPNSVTSISRGAFSFCENLTTITIPNSVTSIGAYAFYGCKNLTTITIPKSVTSIGEGAFRYTHCEASVKLQFPNYKY